jgi:hypothetical protein
MWEWNGESWTEVVPSAGAFPSARYQHGMTYDPVRDRTVVFGGTNANHSDVTDTWEWNGSTWTDVTPAVSPQPTAGHSLVFDRARGKVLMFGHYNTDDVYQWDGIAWTLVLAVTAKPGPRFYPAVTYDDARSELLAYSGELSAFEPALYDTWTLLRNATVAGDTCTTGLDGDGDGAIGCLDDDCFAYCTPLCNPTIMSCDAGMPHCGDGMCNAIESPRLCPADCGAPSAVCGDFLCDAGETAANCPGDCTP